MKLSKHLSDMMSNHNIDAEDAVYAELRADGWSDTEAAFYAFHLTYSDAVAIKRWITRHLEIRPGIKDAILALKAKTDMRMSKEAKSAASVEKRIAEEVERRLKEEIGKIRDSKADPDSDTMSMTKDELGKMYVRIMRSDTDDKTKMDASKAYSALYQMQKQEETVEDNKINFFLPANCHYCDRCRECALKSELEKRGCRVRAKRTSPYLWELVDDGEQENLK